MDEARGSIRRAIIESVTEEVPGVKTITLAMEDGHGLSYSAGQFITLVFTHHDREERRSFSLSSCPDLNEPVSFTVKRVDNGAYSRLLTDRAKPGDILFTTGAAGFFTLPQNIGHYEQVCFLAAGIGITPILPIIKTLLHTQPDVHIVLIYSNRSQQDVVFYSVLQALMTQFSARLRVLFLYSTAFDLKLARLSKSLLHVLLKEYGLTANEKTLYYLCGPFSYMRMVVYSLEEAGINAAQIRKENFNTAERVVQQQLPPDKATHTITATYNKQVYTFPVVFPETILQAAKKQGIALPYSCETGRCGSCAAICTLGKVWHSYNEVLMDIELQRGSILTCTGHPVDGDVSISI
jgi:ferredoxin-NADP reductase